VRYIIHLLPERSQRLAFDALRARLATAIGYNKALDYPTAHVTLLWNIEDQPAAVAAIDAAMLAAALDGEAGIGHLELALRPAPDDIASVQQHLLLPLQDSEPLAALRQRLHQAVLSLMAATGVPPTVREQTWPHLTLAQEIDDTRWQTGLALVRAEGDWPCQPIIGTEVALLARDVAAGEPYTIVHRVALSGRGQPIP
jgi:hypothetical protein